MSETLEALQTTALILCRS